MVRHCFITMDHISGTCFWKRLEGCRECYIFKSKLKTLQLFWLFLFVCLFMYFVVFVYFDNYGYM